MLYTCQCEMNFSSSSKFHFFSFFFSKKRKEEKEGRKSKPPGIRCYTHFRNVQCQPVFTFLWSYSNEWPESSSYGDTCLHATGHWNLDPPKRRNGLPWCLKCSKNPPSMQEAWVQSLDWEDPWRREWLSTPVFLSGECHDRGTWWAAVHGGVTKSWTQLSD